MSKNYWVHHNRNTWSVKREGCSRASSNHNTQKQAWAAASRLARSSGGESFLTDKNGKIREKNTYGYDPYLPKG